MTSRVHSVETLIVWIRRELRVRDHLALFSAVQDAKNVVPVFIIDEEFTRSSPAKKSVVLDGLKDLRSSFRNLGGELFIRVGNAKVILHNLIQETNAGGVYLTKEYQPKLRLRDRDLQSSIESIGKVWKEFKDHVLFEEQEIVTSSHSTPFLVFTPYKRAWKELERNIAPILPKAKRIATPHIASGKIPIYPLVVKESDNRILV